MSRISGEERGLQNRVAGFDSRSALQRALDVQRMDGRLLNGTRAGSTPAEGSALRLFPSTNGRSRRTLTPEMRVRFPLGTPPLTGARSLTTCFRIGAWLSLARAPVWGT